MGHVWEPNPACSACGIEEAWDVPLVKLACGHSFCEDHAPEPGQKCPICEAERERRARIWGDQLARQQR